MAKGKSKSLVVVESPAKARTISRILGNKFDVKASIGHVRDLPERDIGVAIDDNFAPTYVVPKDKSHTVGEIRDAARNAETVYLATDPDREGEAIAWHLLEAANLGSVPLQRVVFHEITPEAVNAAFDHPRDIDMKLVDAQQARRVLDRLVGYKLSPFLWRKVRKGLSAGRVQSVAVRLVVEREREIQAFERQEFWTIDAQLEKPRAKPNFRARLTGYAGKKDKLEVTGEEQASGILAQLRLSAYTVESVQTKTQTRRPSAPFITSTLQQEASRRLGFTAKRTMMVAQQLYEGLPLGAEGETGLITYMRTDSTNLASSAIQEARQYIARRYGHDFVPPKPREFKKKVKGAQEAHEAIRPTSVNREPDAVKKFLNNDQYRLYNLVWQRMVSCQMADAVFDVTTADIHATPPGAAAYLLRATNSTLRFPGFRQVYEEARDDGAEEDAGNNPMPDLAKNDSLNLIDLFPEQRFTEPPPRYTEATLVKALEEKGIGRPSTYAPTMSTIQDRGYVEREGRQLKPADLGFVVNDLLVEHFPTFVDVGFTAGMEDELDEVASGERPWQPVVGEFYNPLQEALDVAFKEAKKVVEETDQVCPESGHPMVIRWGRRGRFLACSGFPECKYTAPLEGEAGEEPQAIEEPCPECGKPLLVRRSRRGPFIGCSGYPGCRYTRPLEAEGGDEQKAKPAPVPTDEKCPKCESPMLIRSGRFGPFLACSRYPECKGAKPLPTGATCPKDGGELVERRTRRGTFYGCSNYPDCDFTVRNRPLPQPCPECGSIITAERDGKARCTSCKWEGEAEPEKQPAAV